MRIRLHDNETIVAIDTHDGRLVEIRYRLVDKSKGARGIAVRFGDWRASGSGLVYPYSARGYEDGRTVFDMATQTVEVDPPLPESLFSAGLDRAGPSRSR